MKRYRKLVVKVVELLAVVGTLYGIDLTPEQTAAVVTTIMLGGTVLVRQVPNDL